MRTIEELIKIIVLESMEELGFEIPDTRETINTIEQKIIEYTREVVA